MQAMNVAADPSGLGQPGTNFFPFLLDKKFIIISLKIFLDPQVSVPFDNFQIMGTKFESWWVRWRAWTPHYLAFFNAKRKVPLPTILPHDGQ